MSADIEQQLRSAVTVHDTLPDAGATWARGRSRRRRRVATWIAGAAGSAVLVVVGAGALLVPGPLPSPVIVEPAPTDAPTEPSSSPAPSPSPSPSPSPTVEPAASTGPVLEGLGAVGWVAVSADGRTLTRSGSEDLDLPAGAALAYPDRMHTLIGGGVVWQVDGAIWVAMPTDVEPRVLASGAPDGFSTQRLTGVGEIDGEPVVLASRDLPSNLNDDPGGEVVALRLDGEVEVLLEYASSYEAGTAATGLVDGWMLLEEWDLAERVTLVIGPHEQRTVVARVSENSSVEPVLEAVLTAGPAGASPRVVLLTREEHPDAPYARNGFEILDAADVGAGPLVRREVVELDDWLPKGLSASGTSVLVSVLPDARLAFSVDLATGEVARHTAPGLVSLVPAAQADRDVDR